MSRHTLEEIKAEYRRLDALRGVDSRYIPVKISKRATNRYGCCHWRRVRGECYPQYISISDFILDCEDEFWDVIRHEYAHLLVTLRDRKNHGHDDVWKAACREVGCRPKRISCDPEAHQKAMTKREAKYKYEVRCEKCGACWKYLRATKCVQDIQKGKPWSHTGCSKNSLRLIYLR